MKALQKIVKDNHSIMKKYVNIKFWEKFSLGNFIYFCNLYNFIISFPGFFTVGVTKFNTLLTGAPPFEQKK